MIGGIAGPGAIAGSALSGALGGILGGARGQTAAQSQARNIHSMHDLHEAMKAGYRGAVELDELLSTRSHSGIAPASDVSFTNCRFENNSICREAGMAVGLRTTPIVVAAREMTLNEQLHADAIDDWDREFEDKTGALPPFSRLVPLRDAY